MDRLRLKHRLIDESLTLVELARKTSIAYDRLVRIVNGYRTARDEEIEAIARVLGLSPSALVGEDKN